MSSDLSTNPAATAAGSPAPGGLAAPAPETAAAPAKPAVAKSAWSPLAVPAFRALWVAYLVSLVGTWAREAGGPWLMRALKEGHADAPTWVSLIQTAGTLPICLLSIAAGVLADIYDRRNLLILTNVWMLIVSALLGIATLAGWASPVMLLTFTALLGIGAALAGPAFQYVIPELVPPAELPLAVALNSVALNVARAVGPVIGMVIVIAVTPLAGKVPGIGASFLVNAAAFVGVIWVLARWRRDAQKKPAHPETLWGATVTAFRYTRHSAPLRAILVRVAGFILCAVIIWAQLPIIARRLLGGEETTYLFLMGAVGIGAVIGVMFMPKMDKRFSTEGMVTICTIAFGLAVMAVGLCQGSLKFLAFPMMMVVGFNWVIVPTNFNIATQRSVPGWVKGRAIAMYMTVLFGSFAVGSPIWGAFSSRIGISGALLIAGALVCLGSLLAIPFPLTRAKGHDFTPAARPAPSADARPAGDGSVEVAIDYDVPRAKAGDFLRHMHHEIRRQRLRNGAVRWRLEHEKHRDESGDVVRYHETFALADWSDLMRFHARTTRADAAAEERAASFRASPGDPPAVAYRNIAHLAPADAFSQASARHLPHPTVKAIDWEHCFTRLFDSVDEMFVRLGRDAKNQRERWKRK
jgi:MFS family permease